MSQKGGTSRSSETDVLEGAMKKSRAESNELTELRKRAEAGLEREAMDSPGLSPEETRKLVHELRTHQIELEMQNEELRRSQEKLGESRDRYSDLYDFAPVGYVTTSHKGLILEANLALAEMLGVERRALVRHPLSAFIIPDDQDIYYRHRREVLESKQRDTCRLRMLRRDGEPLWAQMDSILIEADDENDTRLRTVISDITERKRAEETLTEANERLRKLSQMQSDFVSVVSHELRTPLTSIKNATDLLASGKTGELSETQQRFVDMLVRNIDRLAVMINDLLDLSKLEAGKLELHLAELAPGDALRQALAMFRPQAEARALTLELDCPRDLPPVYADPDRTQQILCNLLSNALKFTPKGGRIVLAARAAGESVEISVTDAGVGIPADQQERIFERFGQTEDPLTRSAQGTGLGLAIVKELVELQGGGIWVESEVGVGSRFAFTVPARSTEAVQAAALAAQIRPYLHSPTFSMLAVALDRGSVEDTVLDRYVAILREGLPRSSDLIIPQPPLGRLMVVLPETRQSGARVVKAKIERALSQGAATGRGTLAAAVLGPVTYPDDGMTARALLDALSELKGPENPPAYAVCSETGGADE